MAKKNRESEHRDPTKGKASSTDSDMDAESSNSDSYEVEDERNEDSFDGRDSFYSHHREDDQEGRGSGLAEALKKIVSAGIGAAFMTEESIRSYLQEVRLPKDVLNIIIQGAGKSKEELLNRVGNEVVKIISKIDFVGEASRFVEEHKFRVSAEVEVIKKEKSTS